MSERYDKDIASWGKELGVNYFPGGKSYTVDPLSPDEFDSLINEAIHHANREGTGCYDSVEAVLQRRNCWLDIRDQVWDILKKVDYPNVRGVEALVAAKKLRRELA